MTASIADLLRYKQKVDLRRNNEVIGSVWLRVLGDYDLQLCYKQARIASAKMRAALRTVGSLEYEDHISVIPTNNSREECVTLIKQSKLNNFLAEAYASIDREEPPKIDEVAAEPDAPTLEEQEKLDKISEDQESTFQQKIRQYMEEHTTTLEAELAQKSDDEIFAMTQFEMSNVLSLGEFQTEVQTQKVYRATFTDEKCKTRAFADIDEYRNAHTSIKDQLLFAYNALELSPDEIKN